MAILISEALTDLNHLSDLMGPSSSFPNTDLDRMIHIVNGISQFILTYTHRPSFKYYSIASELGDGDGTELLKLNYWPIISLTSVYDDVNRTFGSETLITSTDLEIYKNNGNSMIPNSGMVRHLNGTFSKGLSNIKSIYTSGYSLYEIQEGYNDQIVVAEGSGANVTVALAASKYNASTLATEIGAKLTADATLIGTYTVTYLASHRFKIAGTTTFHIKWLANGTRHKELGKLIGYKVTEDDVNGTSYISDYPGLGIPEDLLDLVNTIVRWEYTEVQEKRIGKFSESRESVNYSFDYSNMPAYILDRLRPYILWSV